MQEDGRICWISWRISTLLEISNPEPHSPWNFSMTQSSFWISRKTFLRTGGLRWRGWTSRLPWKECVNKEFLQLNQNVFDTYHMTTMKNVAESKSLECLTTINTPKMMMYPHRDSVGTSIGPYIKIVTLWTTSRHRYAKGKMSGRCSFFFMLKNVNISSAILSLFASLPDQCDRHQAFVY